MADKNATEMQRADKGGISRATDILRAGGIVALPTETVYGLAARADSAEAVAKIYAAKGRPGFNPLIVHIDTIEQARAVAEFPPLAEALVEVGWPGALSLVLPLKPGSGIAGAVTAGLGTIALRMPAHPVMRAVIAQTGVPLAAPSANASNGVSPTTADHVAISLDGRIDLILDGGPCENGLESSIVAVRHDGTLDILRPGSVDPHALLGMARPADADRCHETKLVEAPGQLRSHYSPGKPVRLDARSAEVDEFHIGFGEVAGHLSLSPSGDLRAAAAALYSALHYGAKSPLPRIAVAPIPDESIGIAINDRLRRAAA